MAPPLLPALTPDCKAYDEADWTPIYRPANYEKKPYEVPTHKYDDEYEYTSISKWFADESVENFPDYFTSGLIAYASPDEVVNANNTVTPGAEGSFGTFAFGLNAWEDVICYVRHSLATMPFRLARWLIHRTSSSTSEDSTSRPPRPRRTSTRHPRAGPARLDWPSPTPSTPTEDSGRSSRSESRTDASRAPSPLVCSTTAVSPCLTSRALTDPLRRWTVLRGNLSIASMARSP